MKITVEVPDDIDPVRLAEAKRVVETGEYLVFHRPPAMTNEEAWDASAAIVDAFITRYGKYGPEATKRRVAKEPKLSPYLQGVDA